MRLAVYSKIYREQTLNDTSFNSQVDEVFLDIEERVDELADDIDIDSSGGVLTFTFQDGGKVILSRQVGSHEIWVAAKSGGFHLKLDDDNWSCGATGENLATLVDRVFVEQGAAGPFS